MSEALNAAEGGLRKYKPYPAYRDSGVEWIGEIPDHWNIKPLQSFAQKGYKTFTDGDWIETPYIRSDGIRLIQTGNIGDGEYKEQGFRYIDEATFKKFQCTEVLPEDILICRLAEPVGRACLAPNLGVRMITSVDVCILKASPDVNSKFLVFLLSNRNYLDFMSAICRGGTRDRVSRSMLSKIRLQFPPQNEQIAISLFLEKEKKKIDALIEKKERLIELLQEKRSALITHAVTKGLDPTVPMKDSGVEWIGEIPKHWDIKRNKRLFIVVNGSTPKSGEADYWDGDIPWVTPDDLGGLSSPEIFQTRRYITKSGYESCGTTLVPKNSLVLSTRAPIGHLAIAGVDLCTNQGCRSLKFRNKSNKRFYYYQMFAANSELQSWGQGSTFRELSKSKLEYLYLTEPSYKEQNDIASFLDREIFKIDALIEKIRQATERLKEYRTALISAAVTGKIDVREETI